MPVFKEVLGGASVNQDIINVDATTLDPTLAKRLLNMVGNGSSLDHVWKIVEDVANNYDKPSVITRLLISAMPPFYDTLFYLLVFLTIAVTLFWLVRRVLRLRRAKIL